MEKYVWLFPILFIFHDMEEIIGFGIWREKNKNFLKEKYPNIWKMHESYSTEGMALAVFEELIVCLLFCLLALWTDSLNMWLLWLGVFIAYALHLVIHMIQAAIIKQYIPAVATSILCLPISVWYIWKSVLLLQCSTGKLFLFSLLGIVVVAVNLKFAQSLIGRFTRWMKEEVDNSRE